MPTPGRQAEGFVEGGHFIDPADGDVQKNADRIKRLLRQKVQLLLDILENRYQKSLVRSVIEYDLPYFLFHMSALSRGF